MKKKYREGPRVFCSSAQVHGVTDQWGHSNVARAWQLCWLMASPLCLWQVGPVVPAWKKEKGGALRPLGLDPARMRCATEDSATALGFDL